jgi:hypothetical protein
MELVINTLNHKFDGENILLYRFHRLSVNTKQETSSSGISGGIRCCHNRLFFSDAELFPAKKTGISIPKW